MTRTETDLARREFISLAAVLTATACGGGGGGGGGTSPGPSLPAIAAFTSTPASIAQGQSATLSWSVTGATSLSIDAPGGASVLGLASLAVTPAATTVFTLNASNAAGSVSRTVTVTVVPPPDFALTLGSPSLAVAPGTSASVTVTAARVGGFSGEVALSATGLPVGLTASFAPNPLPGATSTLTIQATGGATPGMSTVTIQGVSGGITRSVILNLEVTSGADFGLSLTAADLTVAQGANGATTVQIAGSGGFAGAVTFSLQGAPGGVIGTFMPNPAPGASSQFSIAVGAAVPPGVYPLTIQGQSGSLVHGTPLALTVVQPMDFSVGLSIPALSLAQGASTMLTVTLTRTGGFGGAVTLALLDAPAGLSGAFVPNSTSGASSELTLSAAAAPLGIHLLRVQGSSGALVHTANLSVTVTAVPDFAITLNTGTVNAPQGGGANAIVTIQRSGGFSGAIAFSLLGTPAGVTGAFTPNNTTGNTSSLALAVGAAVPVGTHPLTVQGQSGALLHGIPLSLVVTASTTLITTNDTKASFTTNTCRAYLLGSHQFYVCKDNGGVYALTSICTHQGCDVNFQNPPPNAVTFRCPCHGSEYDGNGFNTQGPATIPLVHYLVIEPSPGANLVVNKDVTVAAGTRLT